MNENKTIEDLEKQVAYLMQIVNQNIEKGNLALPILTKGKRFILCYAIVKNYSDRYGTWNEIIGYEPVKRLAADSVKDTFFKHESFCEFDTVEEATNFAQTNIFGDKVYIKDTWNNKIFLPKTILKKMKKMKKD